MSGERMTAGQRACILLALIRSSVVAVVTGFAPAALDRETAGLHEACAPAGSGTRK